MGPAAVSNATPMGAQQTRRSPRPAPVTTARRGESVGATIVPGGPTEIRPRRYSTLVTDLLQRDRVQTWPMRPAYTSRRPNRGPAAALGCRAGRAVTLRHGALTRRVSC